MRNPDLGATGTDFIAILQYIDYSKFERLPNVADEISAKLLSGFLEYDELWLPINRILNLEQTLPKEKAGPKTR